MIEQMKERIPKRRTIIFMLISLLWIFWIYSFLTNTQSLEDIRLKNLAYAKEQAHTYSWNISFLQDQLKRSYRDYLYYKAIQIWNTQTWIAKDPSLFYKIDLNKINIELKLDNWTASWAPLSSAPERKKEQVNTPLKPDQLFYTTNILDKCYVSQKEEDHFKSNGRLATDVACNGRSEMIYAPDFKNRPMRYRAEYSQFPDTWNTILLHFTDWETKYFWLIWHANSFTYWTWFITWEWIWYMDLSWMTEWFHVHIELWKWSDIKTWDNISYRKIVFDIKKQRTSNIKSFKWWDKFYFTPYNLWDVNQNDNAPCIWASWNNQCKMEASWIRTIAITKDLRSDLWLKFWDKIKLTNWPCAWIYQIEDDMHCRFRWRLAHIDYQWKYRTCYLSNKKTKASWSIFRNWYLIKWDIPSCWGGVHTITKL